MKYIFIVNEKAGKGNYKKIVPNIEKICKEKEIEYEIRYTSDELDGAQIAGEYKDEENIIFSMGGDGTITRILEGIVGTKNKLGIIPSGSGNDTYRAVKNLPKGLTEIDLGKINDRYFINVACTGLDAEVANNVDIFKDTVIPSSQIYNASILYTFLKYRFKKAKLETSIRTIEEKYSILSICNGAYYGGGFNIAPKSKLTDGLLDLYYVEKMPRLNMIPLLLKVKKGEHEGKRKVHKFRTNHIEINLKEMVTFNVDGEQLTDNRFIIDVVPKAITIYNDTEFINAIMSNNGDYNYTMDNKQKEKV